MFRSLTTRYRQWRLRRDAISALHTFDDRKLTDIGTFRDSIELFVAARTHAGLPEE